MIERIEPVQESSRSNPPENPTHVSPSSDGVFGPMRMNQLTTSAAVLMATTVLAGGGLRAQPTSPQPESPSVAAAKSKPAESAEMAQVEAKLTRLRELIRPQPGEYATNIARIAWERDPWEAAVKAGREGKPVIAYGVHSAGVTCGYG